MNVLLTGATGYIGSRIAEKLMARGYKVTAFVRSEEKKQEVTARGMSAAVGHLEEPAAFLEAAECAEAVIHTAFDHSGDFFEAVEVEARALDALLKGLAGKSKTLIATSAAGVLGDTGGSAAKEDAALPAENDWPVAKRGALETKLLAAAPDIRTVVLRLPVLVYGHGASQFPPMLLATAKEKSVSYYVGNGTNKISAAHVDDIAELYVLALDKAPAGSLYNVAVGNPVCPKDLAEAVGQAAGVGDAKSISQEEAGELWTPFVALLLSSNFWLSGDKAQRELGWTPEAPSLLDDLRNGSYKI